MPVPLIVLLVSVLLVVFTAIAARAAVNVMQGIARKGKRVPAILKKAVFFWYAWVDGQTIHFENEEERRSISIDEIVAIIFHYDTVAGFNEWLELVPPDGNGLIIDLQVDGMTEVLRFLCGHFEDLTRARLDECISKGDVTDSCTIWSKPGA